MALLFAPILLSSIALLASRVGLVAGWRRRRACQAREAAENAPKTPLSAGPADQPASTVHIEDEPALALDYVLAPIPAGNVHVPAAASVSEESPPAVQRLSDLGSGQSGEVVA